MISSIMHGPELDQPIWSALTTTQAHLGYGNHLARRYDTDVAPFAALASETAESYEALAQLLSPRERVLLKTFDPLGAIKGFHTNEIGFLHQMVLADQKAQITEDPKIVTLNAKDISDILALVARTKPGPFGRRTLEMGNYIGVRDNGLLVAMAGERIHFDGHVEISAVCVDPDCRGKGFARRLVLALSARIAHQNMTPFLHVLADNASAIGLYKNMGFEVRRSFWLSAMSKVA